MKTNELRIGNIVWNDYSGEMIVVGIRREGVDLCKTLKMPSGSYRDDDIHSIFLTEEWLLKFGAKKLHAKLLWLSLSNLKTEIHFEIFEKEIVCMILSEYCKLILDPIKYVHQLQNLYFALTGEELIVSHE